MEDHADLIARYFDYLVSEYGFRIEEKLYDPQAMGNAVVIFSSPNYVIEVVIDRNQVLMRIGEPSDIRWEWFEFTNVVRYYAPEVKEVYVFPEKTPENTWEEVVELQLRRQAINLRHYCEPLLKGELWAKEQVEKIEAEATAEILRRLGQAK